MMCHESPWNSMSVHNTWNKHRAWGLRTFAGTLLMTSSQTITYRKSLHVFLSVAFPWHSLFGALRDNAGDHATPIRFILHFSIISRHQASWSHKRCRISISNERNLCDELLCVLPYVVNSVEGDSNAHIDVCWK